MIHAEIAKFREVPPHYIENFLHDMNKNPNKPNYTGKYIMENKEVESVSNETNSNETDVQNLISVLLVDRICRNISRNWKVIIENNVHNGIHTKNKNKKLKQN